MAAQSQSLHIPGWSDRGLWALALALIAGAVTAVLLVGHPGWWLRVALAGLAPLALFFSDRTGVRVLISAAILILAGVVIFYRLGEGSFYDWDEAYYAEVARELAQSKSWGTLTFGGYPFWHKPPLYFWGTALLARNHLVDEFIARFLPAVAGLGVVALTLVFGIGLFSWAVGALAAILLLVVDHGDFSHWYNFVSQSRVAMLETMLTLWLSASLLLVWTARRRPRLICCIGVTAGLAVMTKSWVGFAAFALPLLYSMAIGEFRKHLRYWAIAGGILLAVILPWHIWQIWLHGSAFIHDYFVVNVLGRVLGLVQQEARGPLFYLGILRRGFGIFAYAGLMAAAWALWSLRRGDSAQKTLLLVWIVVPLLLFSAASTKLGWYVLLIYPAIALLIARATVALAGGRLAVAGGALAMALLYFRLPVPSDGVPGIAHFAAAVEQTVQAERLEFYNERGCNRAPTMTGYTQSEAWSITPTLIYYIDRPLSCTDRMPYPEAAGEPRYVLIDKAQLDSEPPISDAVVQSQRFLLVRAGSAKNG